MALKLSLKPNERLVIGGAVITNGPSKTELMVENKVPILRHKHIIGPKEADTPAKRIYLTVQLMYVDSENLTEYHKIYWELVHDFRDALPRSIGIIDHMNEHIVQNRYYDALKTARQLIDFEQEVLDRAKQCCESL